jgi:hypothetical protein
MTMLNNSPPLRVAIESELAVAFLLSRALVGQSL